MAEKINVEIGLDGGAEVTKQLEEIGQAGQKALGDIQGAADQLNLESATDEFKNLGNAGVEAFNKVQQAAQSAVISEQVIQGVKKVEGAFEALGNAVAKIGTRMTRSLGVLGVAARALGPLGIALGVAGGAFVKFGDDAADALNALTVNAAKLGQTPQQLDVLQKALTQAGVGADAILPGLQKLRETLDQEFFPRDTTTGLQQFIAQLEHMPDSVARTQLAIQTLGDALGGQVIAGLQAGTLSAESFASALGQITPATQQQITDAQKYQAALNELSAAWTGLKAAFTPITTPLLDLLTTEIKNLTTDIQGLITQITALWNFLSALGGIFSAQGPDEMAAAIKRLSDAFAELSKSMTAAAQAAPKGFQPWTGGDASKAGFASGGMIGGRGTGTSDSNLAWVSRGEHIMPARAVAQPGVLGFLEALRRSGGNLRGVLDGLGRFALGGLVPRPLGAAGGSVGTMSHVTINFPGLAPVTGLRASAAVVGELQKAAALAQVRSGGRKPSRYS